MKKVSKLEQHENALNLSHSMAHYLIAIHQLKENNGYVRAIDVAKLLGFTKGSVSTALKNLKSKKLIEEDENHFLSLTEDAHEMVHGVLSARTLLFYFFKNFLGVSKEHSHMDACLTEHLLSPETQKKLFDFMKKIASFEDDKKRKKLYGEEVGFLTEFKNFKDFKENQDSDPI